MQCIRISVLIFFSVFVDILKILMICGSLSAKLISSYAWFDWSRYKKCPPIHRCISGNAICVWQNAFPFTTIYGWARRVFDLLFFLECSTDRNGKRERCELKELNDCIQVGSYLCSVFVLTKYFDSIGLKKNVLQKIFFHFTKANGMKKKIAMPKSYNINMVKRI